MSLKQRLHEQLSGKSQASRNIASYILANLNNLPFENGAVVAGKLGVSESTIGRFSRALGFKHFKALKVALTADLSDSPWLLGDRLKSFQQQGEDEDALGNSLQLEIAALVRVYEYTRTERWHRVTHLIAQRPQVLVAGFGTERGIASSMVHMLQYLRDRVHLVDGACGHFGEVLLSSPQDSMLVVYEARRYSRHALLLCSEARKRSIPVILITDNFCGWADHHADEVFRVSTELGLVWDSTSTMLSLTHLLINEVSKQLGSDVESHLESIARLHQSFVGYVKS